MATVYLCVDSETGARVALKVLREEIASAISIERFLREIALSSDLDHPRIPRVLGSGVHDGLPFYVMSLVEGESLKTRLDRERQLTMDDAIRIACGIADPMAHAHSLGIVHRDIKPANIILGADGVYVLDFGIARAIVQSADERLTSTGVALGTPAYMSPEQALGDQRIDARSDIYSLGCVTFEMIAGIPPFVGATSQAILARRFVAHAPPLSETRDGVPEHVEAAVARALMRAPADRWQTAGGFAAAISQSSHSKSATFARLVWRLRRRRRLMLASVGIPLLLLGGATIAWMLGGSRGGSRHTAQLDPRRVAVLYFDDHSTDKSLGYLASGLTEGLIQELSGVPALQVISRNGVKPFRDGSVTVDSIASLLGIGTIVEGSVQKSGDRLRVRAQIVNANTGTPVETATIEREVAELFVLEDELAQQVSRLLRRRIGSEVRLGETRSAAASGKAKELVFRAAEALDRAGNADIEGDQQHRMLEEADSLFSAAIAAAPRWTTPMLGRGRVALAVALRTGGATSDRALRDAVRHAHRVLAVDSSNAEAFELSATATYTSATRFPRTDPEFTTRINTARSDAQRALRLEPTLASAWGTMSHIHAAGGDLASAESAANTAFRMDAYLEDAPRLLWTLYRASSLGGDMKTAERWCLRGAREYPSNPQFVDCRLTLVAEDPGKRPNARLAWELVAEGERLEPMEKARASGRPYLPVYRMMLGAVASARAGDTDRARAVAARARRLVEGDEVLQTDLAYDEAYLRLVMADRAGAIAMLSQYLAVRPSRAAIVYSHRRWQSIRKDSAFLAAIRRAGFTAE